MAAMMTDDGKRVAVGVTEEAVEKVQKAEVKFRF